MSHYFWFFVVLAQGLSFSDLMFVTQCGMAMEVTNLREHLQIVSVHLDVSCNFYYNLLLYICQSRKPLFFVSLLDF